MINIAVVGTGIIGIDHIKAIQTCDLCRLCAVCDVNEKLAKEISEEYNVPYFTDYKKIPNEVEIDAVILNLPHYLHCESTVFFLNKGINVLVEKPMAMTTEECDKMIEAADKNGKKLAVGHIQRFFSWNRKIKQMVQKKELGNLCMCIESRNCNYFSASRPKWFLDKEKSGGGILMNYCAHTLDKLFSLMEISETDVYSSYGNIKNDCNIEGHGQILFTFKNGVSAVASFNGYSDIPGYNEYLFDNGIIRLDEKGIYYKTDGEWMELDLKGFEKEAMVYQIKEFCKFIKGENSITPDGLYGKKVIEAIEKIYACKQ